MEVFQDSALSALAGTLLGLLLTRITKARLFGKHTALIIGCGFAVAAIAAFLLVSIYFVEQGDPAGILLIAGLILGVPLLVLVMSISREKSGD